MQTSLEGIAKKAQREKKYRFQNLYGMIDTDLLTYSWTHLNKNAASGVDGISYREYGENVSENIEKLVGRLKEKKYRAKLVRRQYIPKGNGKMRPLGIPAIEDKLVQYAAMLLLQGVYEQDFLPCMYGYRAARGAKDAVVDLRNTLQDGKYNYVVEADIKGFFDNISHSWLIKMLEQRVDDKAFIRLITKWLKAGVLDTDNKVIHPVTGTPQGGIISPVLANIYMHYAICLWFEKVYKKQCKGKAYICMYADDFVCAFEEKKDAEKFYAELKRRLEKFGLELSIEKTNIIYFGKRSNNTFDFLGFEFRMSRLRRRFIRIRTSRKKMQGSLNNFKIWCKENRNLPMWILINELNTKLKGYYNYYGIKGNSKSLSIFFRQIVRTLFKWVNRRSQRKSYNWSGFIEAIKAYGILKPRLVYGFSE